MHTQVSAAPSLWKTVSYLISNGFTDQSSLLNALLTFFFLPRYEILRGVPLTILEDSIAPTSLLLAFLTDDISPFFCSKKWAVRSILISPVVRINQFAVIDVGEYHVL